MFSDLTGPVKAVTFYVITLGLALILAVFFSGTFGEATAMLTMLTPAIAMLIMMLVSQARGDPAPVGCRSESRASASMAGGSRSSDRPSFFL